jgi:hypothetical protein
VERSQLDPGVTLAALLQLKVLEQFGGIWIDSRTFLTEKLNWLETLKN